METLLTYFIKVSVLVMLFYLSYHFLLKKETFFGKNRMFLLLGLVTALVLPLITITKTVWTEPEPILFNEPVFIPFEEVQTEIISQITEEKTDINWSYIVAGLYFLGALFFLLKFVLSSLSLYKILHKTPVKKLNGYKIIDSPKVKTPFSFFSYIAFDSSSFSEEELQNIITHEKVHSNQKHSLDILLSELFLIAFWFNPFVWFYKKAIVQNLEFIADSCAINQSENRINYQKTLLKITLNPESLALANPFYQPLIKKRIMMLNKIKSKKSQLWKYLVVAPLLVLFVMQVQTKVVAQTKEQTLKETIYQGKQGESALILQDTVVWIKDFAKSYENEEWKEDFNRGFTNHFIGNATKETAPLIIINGKEQENIYYSKDLKIQIQGKGNHKKYSPKEAIEKFGEKGKNGAYVIDAEKFTITTYAEENSQTESYEEIRKHLESKRKIDESKENTLTKEIDLIKFLKSAKNYNKIEVFDRWGNLVYTLKSGEKLDEQKLNSLDEGTYFYTIENKSGEKQSSYLYKGNVKTVVYEQKVSDEYDKAMKEHDKAMVEHDKAMIVHNKIIAETKAQENSSLSDEEIQKRAENRKEKLKEREQKLEERKKTVEERRKEYSEKRNEKISEYKIDLDESFSIINKNTTDLQIKEYVSKLKSKNIEMKVSNLKRNKNGEIIKIKISLVESSGTKNNKKESKAESTIEYYDQTIPNIYVGKRNGELLIESR